MPEGALLHPNKAKRKSQGPIAKPQGRGAIAPQHESIADLQSMASEQPSVQRIAQLQALADAGPNEVAQEQAAPYQQNPMQLAEAAADPGAPSKGRADLKATTQLQGRSTPYGSVQYPALVGAPNTPIDAPFANQMGASVTQMARKDYDAWQGTTAANLVPHGVIHLGGVSTVARWQTGTAVAQMAGGLSNRVKGGLVIVEASLTMMAGTAGLIAAGFGAIPLVVPSILALITGVLKFARGCLMMKKEPPTTAIDIIRGIEGVIALVGALLADPTSFYRIPGIIFGAAKSIRSLALLIEHQWKSAPTLVKKGLKAVAAVAHAVEVATVGFSSGAGLVDGISKISGGTEVASGAARTVASIGGLGIGASKAVRAGDQAAGFFAPDEPQPAGQNVPAQQGGNGGAAGLDGGAVPADPAPAREQDADNASVVSDTSEYGTGSDAGYDADDEFEPDALSEFGTGSEAGYDADDEYEPDSTSEFGTGSEAGYDADDELSVASQ